MSTKQRGVRARAEETREPNNKLTFHLLPAVVFSPVGRAQLFELVLVDPCVDLVLDVHRFLFALLRLLLNALHVTERVLPAVHLPRTANVTILTFAILDHDGLSTRSVQTAKGREILWFRSSLSLSH